MHFFAVLEFLIMGVLVVTRHSLAATCTISKYDEENIKSAERDCTDITFDNLAVPAGVTLDLNLNPGTKITFQGTITWGYHEWNGPLLNITGEQLEITGAPDHVLDPKGNLWWDGKGEHGGTIKPVFFVLHGVNNSVIHDLYVKNTPYHAIWIEHSDGVITTDVYVDNKDGSTRGGHNTDGFNVWTSNNVSFERITVYNQDDCIAVKSGTNVLVRDTYCHGGHGLSIGSVGGRDYNIVENVLVSNVEIENSVFGVRIKTVYGATGYVTNVTYEDIVVTNISQYGIIIEGDYDLSTGNPTGHATDGVPITDFTLRNVTGTVKETAVNVYVLVKGAADWHWSGVNVTGGKQSTKCEGIPEDSEISC